MAYLGQVALQDGTLIHSPLSVDSVPYPNWRTLPDLSGRSVRDSGGRQLSVQSFMGGWLVEGCPLNVVYGEPWIAGQQEALEAAGIRGCLPHAAPTPQQYPIIPAGGGGGFQPLPFVPVGTRPPVAQTPPYMPPIVTGPYEPPILGEEDPGLQVPAVAGESMLPYVLLGLGALFFFSRKRG